MMKRSYRNMLALVFGVATMMAATPALAQYSTDGEEAGAALGIAMLCCYGLIGLVALVAFVWWIIMVIDVFKRMEHEFPGSTGSSKTLWLLVLLIGGLAFQAYLIVAAVYYFMIYKKGPKAGTTSNPGGMAPPPPPGGMAPPPPPPGY